MEKALHQLEAVLALSRKTWESIEAETAVWFNEPQNSGSLPEPRANPLAALVNTPITCVA